MSSFISWVKKYPMTMLLIICCLIGGPYFGGQRVIEAYENYMGKAKGADVLEEWTQKTMKQQTLMKADAPGNQRAAGGSERRSFCGCGSELSG